MPNAIYGCYRDKLFNLEKCVVWEHSWLSNLIVQDCNPLLAGLMKRDEGMQGIQFLAIGVGDDNWDQEPPQPLWTSSQLTSEVGRQSIAPNQIVYLDSTGQPTPNPTNRLQVTAEFRGEDLVENGSLSLREFGLFGGNATLVPNSGFMINQVIHPRIDLTSGMTLVRQVRLAFASGAMRQENEIGFGAALPVISIDGVGEEYATDFEDGGILNLSDLVESDPLVSVGNIPLVKLREFRAKARMVMRTSIVLGSLSPFAGHTISGFLIEPPDDLAEELNAPDVTSEMIVHLQEILAVLQVALDDAQLQIITLGDLIHS